MHNYSFSHVASLKHTVEVGILRVNAVNTTGRESVFNTSKVESASHTSQYNEVDTAKK